MRKSLVMAAMFASGCAAGWRDSPRAAQVRKQCMQQVASTNSDQLWMEKYCDGYVKNAEAEWGREEAEGRNHPR